MSLRFLHIYKTKIFQYLKKCSLLLSFQAKLEICVLCVYTLLFTLFSEDAGSAFPESSQNLICSQEDWSLHFLVHYWLLQESNNWHGMKDRLCSTKTPTRTTSSLTERYILLTNSHPKGEKNQKCQNNPLTQFGLPHAPIVCTKNLWLLKYMN